MRKASHAVAVASLGGTAFIWGGTFGAVKFALNAGMGVEALLAYRFLIGTLGLAVFLLALRIKPQAREVKDGLWLGLLLSTLFWLQTDGLRFTTTTKSGFITGLYVIFTPMAAAFAGDRLKGSHAVGALIALAGLSFLVYQPGVGLAGWNRGDTETLLNAILVGVHIVMTSRFSRRSSGWVLAYVQVAFTAVVMTAMAAFSAGGFRGAEPSLRSPGIWISLAYLGLMATTLALWVQSTMQAKVTATEAAILFSLEPVFAALLAVSGFIPGIRERLGPWQIAGAGLIVAATLVAELGPRLLKRTATS
ncbi:MAG TPA: DMT family transporter [Holophagaceae bacterium]|jgi:drug/metabolite transporter (DMT)-like permease|nr:DMT family transporter [Holophagaceae bacterium]